MSKFILDEGFLLNFYVHQSLLVHPAEYTKEISPNTISTVEMLEVLLVSCHISILNKQTHKNTNSDDIGWWSISVYLKFQCTYKHWGSCYNADCDLMGL